MNNKIMNWNYARGNLFVQLIPAYQNVDILSNCPHFKIFDLALIYRVREASGNKESILVTNRLMRIWRVTEDKLHEAALRSASRIRPSTFKSVGRVMYEITGMSIFLTDDTPLYVASVENGEYGAAAVFYNGYLEQVAEEWNANLIILPSSVHECLILPDYGNQDMDLESIESIVKEVNIKEVSPEDKLSDNVYYYDRKTKAFTMAKGHLK